MQKRVFIHKRGTTIRALSAIERRIGEKTLLVNLAARPTDRILIVTDREKKVGEAAIFFEAAKKSVTNVTLVEMPLMEENAQEPPPEVSSLLNDCDIALLVTSFSLTHTAAVEEAGKNGARIASMPGITRDVILRTLSIDYTEVATLSKKVASIFTAGTHTVLQSDSGTDVFFDLSGRSGLVDTGLLTNAGDMGNLPGGEAFIAPKEGKTEGIVVFDGAFAEIAIDQPITITIEKGKVVDIKGGEGARLLNLALSRIGKAGYTIAELGVGTNKMARLDSILLEVEKVFGTVHVAIGNNAYIGGEVDVPFHSDGVILKPTLKVDRTTILKNGRFQI